ncbi:tail fiber domain-containing protein [Bordetella hinzii]|uniref:tail fiber domain-containing protein n=1 Tax=Bordetella hinzii TaxID=103855 RepID=UPI002A18B0F8|nr:tail fiber domain-containing protein [Bordetella hinzii]WPL79546.1 tail fiber domain-containing protein [Bordetella hinzii]
MQQRYWREASIWLDSTRGVNLPELNNYPATAGVGADGISLVRVTTSGGKWGIRKMGPLPKPARLKTPVRPMSAAELAAAKDLAREIGFYKRLSSIEREGEEVARWHAGMTVQRAIEILVGHGLDPFELGFICYDQWDDQYRQVEATLKESGEFDETGKPIMVVDVPAHQVLEVAAGDRYGFRMDELLAFIQRGLVQRQDELEARVLALEGRP